MNSFIKHIRTIQFLLMATCFASVATAWLNTGHLIEPAITQLKEIASFTKDWPRDDKALENKGNWPLTHVTEGLKSAYLDMLQSSKLNTKKYKVPSVDGMPEIIFSNNELGLYIETNNSQQLDNSYFKENVRPVVMMSNLHYKIIERKRRNNLYKSNRVSEPKTIKDFKKLWAFLNQDINFYRSTEKPKGFVIKKSLGKIPTDRAGKLMLNRSEIGREQYEWNIKEFIPADNNVTTKDVRFDSLDKDEVYNTYPKLNAYISENADSVHYVKGEFDSKDKRAKWRILIPVFNREKIGSVNMLSLLTKTYDMPWKDAVYEKAFPELSEAALNLEDFSFKKLEVVLNSRQDNDYESLNLFGVKLPVSKIILLGVPAIWLIQFYLLLHIIGLREKVASINKLEIEEPWIGVYKSPVAKLTTNFSIAILPVLSQILLIIRGKDSLSLTQLVLMLMCTFISIIIGYFLVRILNDIKNGVSTEQ